MTRSLDRANQKVPQADIWLVRVLGLVFIGLGLLFLLAPHAGAALFGLPAPEGMSLGYLPAIALRDLAFGLYLLILSATATRLVIGLVLRATLIIPLGDIAIVAFERGFEASLSLILHGLSAAVMAGASLWLLRSSQHNNMGGQS
jgi:hypothetical protein